MPGPHARDGAAARRPASSLSRGAGSMISCQFFQSRLRMSIAIGEPSVSPARTPERNSTRVASRSACGARGRSPAGGARARASTSAARSGRPAGMPSRTLTRAGPCDSPAVVKRSMTMKAAGRRERREPGNVPGSLRLQPITPSPARQGPARMSAAVTSITTRPVGRDTEELEHHRRIVAREGQRGAERSVEVVLRRERAALEVVVRDVDHLDRAVRRGDEGQAVGLRRARCHRRSDGR